MSNKLTLADVFQVIDNHIEYESQFMFVTDKDLAEIICEYVADNYDLIDESMELDDKYQDYYVSLYIDEDGMRFICETARCLDGTYKYSDALDDSLDYFICNDMSEEETNIYLLGDFCSWSWIEVVGEDEKDCEDEVLEDICECPICQAEREVQELDCFCSECSSDHIKEFVSECLDVVFDSDACGECTIDAVVKLAFKCLNLGKENVKHEMTEFLDS